MIDVAVLGAGVMGCTLSLALAERGARVTLFDASPHACAGASRWNEGKIHLGYLYAADPSLASARRVLDGGLAFKRLVERWLAASLDPVVSEADDVYLVHRRSVIDADGASRYYDAVSALVRAHPEAAGYLADASAATAVRLSPRELAGICDAPEIAAGFRVPERSVSTVWVADRLAAAVAAEPRIEPRFGVAVGAVRPASSQASGRLRVETGHGIEGPFDRVVNATWEGRLAIDATRGLPPPPTWSHRYRRSLFVRTSEPVSTPSVVIGVGPFGDVKNYDGRSLYLSWYPSGLAAEGFELAPPAVDALGPREEAAVAEAVFTALGAVLPSVRALRARVAEVRVAGGWVYAAGRGPLDDRRSTLHRRDRIGVVRDGAYLSIDTGKYSIAPWIAEQVARELC